MRRVPAMPRPDRFGPAIATHMPAQPVMLDVIGQQDLHLRIGAKSQIDRNAAQSRKDARHGQHQRRASAIA